MKNETAIKFIEKNGWLSTLPSRLRTALVKFSQLRHLEPLEPVYHAGDPRGGLVGLAAGSLGIELDAGPRAQQKSFLFHPGSWIGEGTIDARDTRLVGLWATRPSTIILVPRGAFHQLAGDHPELWRHLLHMAIENNTRAVQVADALMEKDSRKRLALILSLLGGQLDVYAPEKVILDIEQTELAAIVNLSRSSLNPLLREFERQDVINLGRSSIELLRPNALRKLSSSD